MYAASFFNLEGGSMSQVIKWHGGKHYLRKHIHQIAAPFKYDKNTRPDGWLHRVITHGGGMAEAWGWDYEGVSEVYNDIDGRLTNFWHVLQQDELYERFKRRIEVTPFSIVEWERASQIFGSKWTMRAGFTPEEMVSYAASFFVMVRQSMAGRLNTFAPTSRNRTRRGLNEQVSAWLTAVEGLPEAHQRLIRFLILNDDACRVIRQQDGKHTLFYVDPPYVHSTRISTDVYAHEMGYFAHGRLLVTLGRIQGRFMLSGYDNPLYQLAERKFGWKRHEIELPNSAASGETKRVMREVIWTNF